MNITLMLDQSKLKEFKTINNVNFTRFLGERSLNSIFFKMQSQKKKLESKLII